VKASLVFLRRFAEQDQEAWDAAWAGAHIAHDEAFDDERSELCAAHGQGIISGNDPDVARILAALAAIGVRRTPPG
jgi:hypothetical protein